MPESVQPVTGFELERYLGKWYEIARLDHSFEKGLKPGYRGIQLERGRGCFGS